ncbi:MAG: HD domain-containing protein [Gemmataceae bacterium]
MSDLKLRRSIAVEAARLMYDRTETEYFTAKKKAAQRLCRGFVKPCDLPSNAEIRDFVQSFARMHEGEARISRLRDMRVAALRMMKRLVRFRPRLIGSVLTGHIRAGSDIDLHLFSDWLEPIESALEEEGIPFEVERKQVTKHGEARTFIHIHIVDDFEYELTVYPSDKAHYVFTSSITGKAIERVSIAELEQFLLKEYPGFDVTQAAAEEPLDPYPIFKMLLEPLERVKQGAKYHPEGDALYHSLQVFDRAREILPWDEEFLLAALLHDIGKAIDPADHVAAGLEALEGLITERTAWLIQHHMDALAYKNGTLGHKAGKRLEASEHFEDLLLFRDCDEAGRVPGVKVPTVDEALAEIRDRERENR